MRNPLADPYILGVSGGAGLAVVIFTALAGSLTAFGGFVVAIPSIIGALAAVVLITAVIARFPAIGLEGLILLGVMINSVAGSLIIAIASFLGETQLLSFYRWMLGSFSIETYTSNTLAPAAILTVGLVALLMLDARKLNLLALGAEQASTLGVRAGSTRRYMLAVTGVLTAIAVSLAGLVGFVGLVAPHICRRIWGSDARILLPASALMGATAVVLCDSLARVLAKPTELPAGVVTAVLGAPVFIALLVARARRAGGAE
jgi:iron complex transport system permease protein